MVPELKFGIIVLAGEEEQASPICVPVANILIPAFEALLTSLQPTNQLPPNWQSYVGVYSLDGLNITIYSNQYKQLAMHCEVLFFEDLPMQLLGENVFLMLPPVDDQEEYVECIS